MMSIQQLGGAAELGDGYLSFGVKLLLWLPAFWLDCLFFKTWTTFKAADGERASERPLASSRAVKLGWATRRFKCSLNISEWRYRGFYLAHMVLCTFEVCVSMLVSSVQQTNLVVIFLSETFLLRCVSFWCVWLAFDPPHRFIMIRF